MFSHAKTYDQHKRGQMTIEYGIMLGVIVAIAILAGRTIIRPSMSRLYTGAGTLINNSARQLDGSAPAATTTTTTTGTTTTGGGGGGGHDIMLIQ